MRAGLLLGKGRRRELLSPPKPPLPIRPPWRPGWQISTRGGQAEGGALDASVHTGAHVRVCPAVTAALSSPPGRSRAICGLTSEAGCMSPRPALPRVAIWAPLRCAAAQK